MWRIWAMMGGETEHIFPQVFLAANVRKETDQLYNVYESRKSQAKWVFLHGPWRKGRAHKGDADTPVVNAVAYLLTV